MSEVAALEQKIRAQINEPRLQIALSRDPKIWIPLCSSLDVIGDIEIAIDAFLTAQTIENIGQAYLFVYGLLQALVVQQDAVEETCVALGVQFARSTNLKEIRRIRVAAIGHPANHGAGHSGFISRISLSTSGFQLLVSSFDGTPGRFEAVNLRELIEIQRTELSRILSETFAVLRNRELEHRRLFAGEKLSELIHPTIGYLLEKVFLASTDGPNADINIPVATSHLEMIKEMVKDLRSALARRGLQHIAADKIDDALHAITRLSVYFQEGGDKLDDRRDAFIFASFLEKMIAELREISAEIDREYSEPT